MITIFSLLISGLALLVSIITFFVNKARYNLQQIQTQFKEFNNKFQKLLNFANYQSLINFKYDIENSIMQGSIDSDLEYNNLQKYISQKIDLCKNAYNELLETIDFLEVKTDLKKTKCLNTDFSFWLNENLNNFYLELNNNFTLLYDINLYVKIAKSGHLLQESFNTLDSFYDSVYKNTIMQEAFLIIKRELAGTFSKYTCKSTNLFLSNKLAIKKLSTHMLTFIKYCGVDKMIKEHDFNKISATYNSAIKDVYKNSVGMEKEEFKYFMKNLSKINLSTK